MITFKEFLEDKFKSNYYKGLAPSTSAKRSAHFERGKKMDPDDPRAYQPAPGDTRAETKPSIYTQRYKQMFGEELGDLNESDPITAIRKKAEQSGVSYSILKKVFDRGVAAWRTGHRPGTTPAQWGLARINSFVTGGKTQKTADADLWAQHKGVKTESYFSSNIPNEYNQIRKGSRVSFIHHSMDYGDTEQKIGTVVGSNTQHLRVRDDDGKLYLVRHTDAIMSEDNNLEESSLMTDRAVEAIHRHVIKGENLLDVVFNLITQTNIKLGTKELMRAYISKYGDPNEKERVSPEHKAELIRKYRSH